MATLVLTTVGGLVGGPVGAAIGGILGQAFDRDVLFKPKDRHLRSGRWERRDAPAHRLFRLWR